MYTWVLSKRFLINNGQELPIRNFFMSHFIKGRIKIRIRRGCFSHGRKPSRVVSKQGTARIVQQEVAFQAPLGFGDGDSRIVSPNP